MGYDRSSDLCSYPQQILIFSRLLHLSKTYLLHLQNRITMLSSSQISFEDYRQVHGKLSAPWLLPSKPSMLQWLLCLSATLVLGRTVKKGGLPTSFLNHT